METDQRKAFTDRNTKVINFYLSQSCNSVNWFCVHAKAHDLRKHERAVKNNLCLPAFSSSCMARSRASVRSARWNAIVSCHLTPTLTSDQQLTSTSDSSIGLRRSISRVTPWAPLQAWCLQCFGGLPLLAIPRFRCDRVQSPYGHFVCYCQTIRRWSCPCMKRLQFS